VHRVSSYTLYADLCRPLADKMQNICISRRAGRLNCANHLHPGKAASHPRGGPLHHSCCSERQQAGALSAGEMRRGRAVGYRQQVPLNQLVGHVLAHRPPQKASDRLSRVCTKSSKSASDTLGAHFVLSKWYSNADFMQKITYLMHTLCILCINFMHTMCRL
jgi:hypothetical protein